MGEPETSPGLTASNVDLANHKELRFSTFKSKYKFSFFFAYSAMQTTYKRCKEHILTATRAYQCVQTAPEKKFRQPQRSASISGLATTTAGADMPFWHSFSHV